VGVEHHGGCASPKPRSRTGTMRFPRRTASATSQAQVSDLADDGEVTNTTVSESRISAPRRFFQSSPEIPCRSSVVANPPRRSAVSTRSAKSRS
jgi:hypothetical protein